VGEYTVAAMAAPAVVVAAECLVLRTGLFRDARYWFTLAIALAFQVPVDGLLTRSGRSIVVYDNAATSGIRFPWNIPIEDFGFGFALISLTLMLWLRWGLRAAAGGSSDG
jgi:lycopene cyclase domain-containing protein